MSRGRDAHRTGEVAEINITAERKTATRAVRSVRAIAGRGLEGDRNLLGGGRARPKRNSDLTLIATEALDALREEHGIDLSPAESRRNVATRGIDLNALTGRRFRVGETECLGLELCEPCTRLERLTRAGVIKGLAHRGGLYASIVTDGEIRVGDPVEPLAG